MGAIKMLNKIIADLDSNYRGDVEVLQDIISDISMQAMIISNRKNITGLEFEIKQAVKSVYLSRGSEDVKALTESGRTSNYKDAIEELRNNIVANGKRVIF